MVNKAEDDRINQVSSEAQSRYSVNATPTFILNGTSIGSGKHSLRLAVEAFGHRTRQAEVGGRDKDITVEVHTPQAFRFQILRRTDGAFRSSPALPAVIGPNGCGKSNLFEAMRWVMGENRPTSMRGSEMDDVIFSGSAGRPTRNVAEVTLFIDNSDRTAGAPYNEFETIEVSRRIEREAGSVYRINGRDVRQRDVQIFFADASSGAGSTAFVRQGQIGLLITQKPLARRAILEEAAGIGGLHQRRHEAELRLSAAETNLSRLEDVIREVEGQLASLKRQARQASRYRNLSGHIRKAEALAHYLRWTAAEARTAIAAEELSTAAAAVATATEAAAARLHGAKRCGHRSCRPCARPKPRKAAAHHRLIAQREQLDAEEQRAREAAQRIRQLIAQGQADAEREQLLEHDADSALADLERETRGLQAAAESAGQDLAAAEAAAAQMSQTLSDAENLLERLTAELAEWNAKKASLERGKDLAIALLDSSKQPIGRRPGAAERRPGTRQGCARRACGGSMRPNAPAAAPRMPAPPPIRRAASLRMPKRPKPPPASRWKPPNAKCSASPPKSRR